MYRNHYQRLEQLIKTNQMDIIELVDRIKYYQSKIKVSEETLNHIKDYVDKLQDEIQRFTAEKERIENQIQSFRETEPDERIYSIMKYAYIYGMTSLEISGIMQLSTKTVNRCIHKGKICLGWDL